MLLNIFYVYAVKSYSPIPKDKNYTIQNVRICCFCLIFIFIHFITLGFGLIWQNKLFKDITRNIGNCRGHKYIYELKNNGQIN